MPGKKKKKGKGGKKEGGEGGLPPPPKLDDSRQGALEALLKFRIHGKEDIIEQFQEDTETFRDKNDQLKEKNHYLKIRRGEHYKSLVKQAKEHEEGLNQGPSVEKESVEQALTEKLVLAKKLKEELEQCERSIEETDQKLEVKSEELQVWTHFKDVSQEQNSAKIASIKERLERMVEEEEILQSEYEVHLVEAKLAIDKKCTALMEREKELTSERYLTCMDEDVKAELSDNAWLKKEIVITREIVNRLSSEVDALEHRNIKAIEMVTKERTADVENSREIYLATNRKTLEPPSGETPKQAGDGSGLPSLVNIAQCTNEKGPGGQAGQLEMKLLSLKGHRAAVISPPETFHLPPLDQQLITQSAIPPKSTWPITNSMLKSVVK